MAIERLYENIPLLKPRYRFGPSLLPGGGALFRLWAPQAKTVALYLKRWPDDNPVPYWMNIGEQGWFELVCKEAGIGDLYQFKIDHRLDVPDPASRAQYGDVHGWSRLVDPAAFQWQPSEASWTGRSWEESVLYELHVGTFSPEGTFQGIEQKLDYLVDLGVTAIELMPVADFPGKFSWGYDGVLLFAPDEQYGTPEALKSLIQTAHQKGLSVFLDVVYNHFGPEGNYLYVYAASFFTPLHETPWGAAINFDGSDNCWVREFFIENALYWLEEFHFDGLRFDAVHAICDSSEQLFLHEMAERIRLGPGQKRHIHLVLENGDNKASLLQSRTGVWNDRERYTAQWNDDFHHAAHVLLTGESEGYYSDFSAPASDRSALQHLAICLTEGFTYQGQLSPYHGSVRRGEPSKHLPVTAFVNFLQNHDQIGNRAFGERLSQLASPQALRALWSILLLSPAIPLIFMGEEWQARTPFLFFSDLGLELGPKVREGRRKEFEKFAVFQDSERRDDIPDPNDVSTFEKSRLSWPELYEENPDISDHAGDWLLVTKNLLAVRSREIVPLLKPLTGEQAVYRVLPPSILSVDWALSDGKTLRLVANLGNSTQPGPFPVHESSRVIWGENVSTLAPWSVLWYL